MNTYDMLVTDIVRIKKAKAVLKARHISERDRKEARELITLYDQLAGEFLTRGNNEERERAKEILYELHKI